MENKDKQHVYLRDVDMIFRPGNIQIECKADLAKIVELPCLALCETLYDKNILTCWSSSNKTAPRKSYVLVRYESLDDTNKKIADDLISKGILNDKNQFESGNSVKEYGKSLYIGFDTNPDMLVSDISKKLCEMASAFVYQDIKYNVYTPQYLLSNDPFFTGTKPFGFPSLKTAIGIDNFSYTYDDKKKLYDEIRFLIHGKKDSGLTEQDMRTIANKIGWIYNETNGLLYKDKETLQRHNEYLKKINQTYKTTIFTSGRDI
jgi:hypothetical protein